MSTSSLLQTRIHQLLVEWELPADTFAADIASHVTMGTTVWQKTLPDGRALQLFRLFLPVVKRDEVFLGYVLLNHFFFKAMESTIEGLSNRRVVLIANDLESAYYLCEQAHDLEVVKERYLTLLEERLPLLYFGNQDLSKGIHGQFNTMLTFYKANIEPFPAFVIPQQFLPELLQKIGDWVKELSSDNGVAFLANTDHLPEEVAASRRINVLLSSLCFFFSQNGAEMQSFHKLLANMMDDGRMPSSQITQAFAVPQGTKLTKEHFNAVKKDPKALDFGAMHHAIQSLMAYVEQIVHDETRHSSLYLHSKLLSLTPQEILATITAGQQIGYLGLQLSDADADGAVCRFCGRHNALIQECHILGGSNTGKRFNQSLKQNSERFCVACALSSYLMTKRLGMQFDGGFPVPKNYNVVFHYGRQTDADIETLQKQLNYLVDNANKRENKKILSEIKSELHAIQKRTLAETDFTAWLENSSYFEGAMEAINQMNHDAKSEVIALGSDQQRLLVFLLPQFRSGAKDKPDFVQKRFSSSRLAALTLLALLRSLCQDDGPFYFQTLPSLRQGIHIDTFYVRNEPLQASDVLHRYEAVIGFARQVVTYPRGHTRLQEWILLAEKIIEDPLGTFADVLRDSPIHFGDKFDDFRYKRISEDWETTKQLGVYNAAQYMSLYDELHTLALEVNQ